MATENASEVDFANVTNHSAAIHAKDAWLHNQANSTATAWVSQTLMIARARALKKGAKMLPTVIIVNTNARLEQMVKYVVLPVFQNLGISSANVNVELTISVKLHVTRRAKTEARCSTTVLVNACTIGRTLNRTVPAVKATITTFLLLAVQSIVMTKPRAADKALALQTRKQCKFLA